jgi:hypothetical protein
MKTEVVKRKMTDKEPLGCLSFILIIIITFFFTIPLAIIIIDFWLQFACSEWGSEWGKVCTNQFLIDWHVKKGN